MGLLRETISLLKIEKKRFVLLFTLLSFLFVFGYVNQDREYISSIKLAHNSDSGSSMSSGLGRLVSSIGIPNNNPVTSSTTNFGMIPEVVKSRSFQDKILLKNFDYRGERKELYLILQNKDFSDDLDVPYLLFLARKKLNKKISVSKNLNNPVIGISISSNEKQLSFDIANSVLEQLKEDLTYFQLERISNKINVINNQVDLTKKELSILEEGLRDFRINNSNISDSPSLRMQESRILRDIVAVSNTYSSLRVELELTKTKYLEEANVLQIIDAPNIPVQKSSPRLRIMLMQLIITFSLLAFSYIYIKLFMKSDLGMKIKNTIKNSNDF
tara:strand:- start:2083 stop:3069 length:987 start_codon:yes stop_codon:yes gene_type:complete